jgi:iron complex transport system permease protein
LSSARLAERSPWIALVLLAAAVLAATAIGPTPIPLGRVFALLLHPTASVQAAIVWQIRLPRVLGGVLVGAGLAMAGTVFQALLKNPLADPYIIGTSSGASFGATLVEVLAPASGLLPLGAFAGATAAVVAAYTVARRRRGFSTATVVLVGYALSVLLGAGTSLLLTFNRTALTAIFFWELGGLGTLVWPQVATLAATLAVTALVVFYRRAELDALALGEAEAATLGVPVGRVRWWLILAASLMTAVAVSYAGVIGFVGLVSPHVARRLVGASHHRMLGTAMMGGGLFLLLADTVARSLPFGVGEIPVGIVTALVGGPFFIALLVRTEARGDVR